MVETLVVSRKSDLSKLKSSKDMFYQEQKNYNEDGIPIDTSSTRYVLGTRENLTPHWDKEKNAWSFAGGFEKLLEIAKKLGLRDDKGNLVLPDENSLNNTHDPFFSHMALWNSTFIEDSSLALSSSNPFQEFHMRVLQGREDVIDTEKEDGSVSRFITDKAKLEITSPTSVQKNKEANSGEEDEAMEAYLSLKTTKEKLERIVAILDGDNTSMTQEEMLFFIKDEYVKNDTPNPRFATTHRKYFLYLFNLPNADLEVYSTVLQASRMKIINRNTREGYTFQGEKLAEGTINNDKKLFEYFSADENSAQYLKLAKLIEEKLKLI